MNVYGNGDARGAHGHVDVQQQVEGADGRTLHIHTCGGSQQGVRHQFLHQRCLPTFLLPPRNC